MENGIINTCPACYGDWPADQGACPLCGRTLVKVSLDDLKPKMGVDTKPADQGNGHKNDQGKLRYDLIPVWPLEQVADVMTYGAKTYGDHNWRQGLKYSKLYAAAQRHMNAFWQGGEEDEDSGLPHLAHAAANMLMLLEYCHRGYDDLGLDDRMYECWRATDIQKYLRGPAYE